MKAQIYFIKTLMLMLFLGATPKIFATSFYTNIENLILNPGQTKSFSVGVESEDVISFKSFQFNIEIPEGVRLIDIKKSEAIESFNLINKIEGEGLTGKKIIGIYDFVSGESISGKTDLFLLTVQADSEITPAETSINFSKVIFGTFDGSDLRVGENVVLPLTLFMPVSSISLNETSISLLKGYQFTLIPQITPENASDKTVTWESSNPAIANVSKDGVVSGISSGTTEIIARCGNQSKKCEVQVYEYLNVRIEGGDNTTEGKETNSPAVNTEKGASIQGNDLTIREGQTGNLILNLVDDLTVKPELIWSIEEEGGEFVSITSEGSFNAMFRGLKEGKTKYSVRLSGTNEIVAEGNIRVITGIPITSFICSYKNFEIAKNENPLSLNKFKIEPSNPTNQNLIWSSSNPEVATISPDGLLTPVNPGECEITVSTTDGSELSCLINITVTLPVDLDFKLVVEGVEDDNPDDDFVLFKGQTARLIPKAKDGHIPPFDLIIGLYGHDGSVGNIDPDGIITAKKAGRVEFAAKGIFNKNEEIWKFRGMTVVEDLKLEIFPGSNNTTIGDPENSPAENTENGGSLIGNDLTIRVNQKANLRVSTDIPLTFKPRFIWTLGNEGAGIASLEPGSDNFDATFTGLEMGESEYFIYLEGIDQVIASGKISVIAKSPMTSLAIDPSEVCIPLNSQGKNLSITYAPDKATEINVTWTSKDPSIATVDNEGKVTPVSMGETEITATATDGSDLSAVCKVIITSPVDKDFKLKLIGSDMDIMSSGVKIFEGQNFSVEPIAGEGLELPEIISWTVSDSNVATITKEGLIKGISKGTCRIIVSALFEDQEIESSFELTVVDNLGITLKPSDGLLMSENDFKIRVNQEVALQLGTAEKLTIEPEFVWTLEEDNEETVSINTSEDSFTATFKGLKIGSSSYAISLKDQEEILLTGKISTIAERPLTSLSITPSEVSMAMNAPAIQLTVDYDPKDATDAIFIWTSTDQNIAKVDTKGYLTPVGVGETEILVKAMDGSGLTAQCKVCVTTAIDDAFEFEHDEEYMDKEKNLLTLKVGESFQLVPKAREGYILPEEINWASDDEDIFTVDNEGVITGVSEGLSIVKALATVHGKPVEVKYNVNIIKASSSITKPELNDSDNITVYNLSGMKIKENLPMSELKNLGNGIYIIVKGKTSYKIAIK